MKNSLLTSQLKNIALFFLLSIFQTQPILFAQTASQNGKFRILRGERPPIDLSKVPQDAMEESVLLIRFRPEYAEQLSLYPPALTRNGNWSFNLATIDRLNEIHTINDVEQFFSTPAFAFTEKHKAWGFDLWYKLKTGNKSDIRDIVRDYQLLEELDVAMPEFKKALISDPKNTGFSQILTSAELESLRSNDPRFNDQWHYHNTGQANGTPDADIDLPEAWTIERGNPNVIVAVIDEGIQFTHPDLAGNMWPQIGFNFAAGNSTVVPGSHGCHVGGTIAAVTDNGLGVAGIAGGTGNNDGVRLMSAQVFNEFGNGGFHIAPIWAADQGAAISQNSWGYTAPYVYDQAVLDAIDYFNVNGGGYALIDGGISIFAAGNSNSSDHYYPAYYSGAFSVAATNNKDSKSYYSNFGDWIDISAPGGETLSGSAGGVLSCVTNSGYAFFQGTSMACPHAAGVAALIASYAYGQITPAQLADILRNSTDNHYSANPGFPGLLGTGRLNALQALIETQNYLTGVLNPIGFSAQAMNTEEILLNWGLNPAGNNVLIAWSLTNEFGTPVSLQVYQTGNSIPGGGSVLYSGSETMLLHQNLDPATNYYYKIWAFDETLTYSSGRPAHTATLCPLYHLPVTENFEDSDELPTCWVQEFAGGNINWMTGQGNGGSNPPAAYEGVTNIFFRAQEPWDAGKSTSLVLPKMNLAPYDSVELKFYLANAMRTQGDENFQDVLKIKYKPVAHAAWQELEVFNTDIPAWTEISVLLPAQSSTYYLAFEATSNLGHGICIDNVQITGYGTIPVFNISAAAAANGTIAPAGNILAGLHANASFLIKGNPHHVIDSLMVDGAFVDAASGSHSYEYQFINVTTSHQILASFRLVDYQVKATSNPSIAGVVQGTGSHIYGSQASLLAVPAEGFTFRRWFEGGPISSDNPLTFNVYTNRNLIALFSPIIHTVSVAVPNPGAGSVTGNGSYIHGNQVSVSFIPEYGYELANWTEGGTVVSSENPYIFSITASRNFVANHQLINWNIFAQPSPQNSGSISGTGTYVHGSNVTLSASAATNYVFAGWKENGSIISLENPFSFVADHHTSLVALFDLNTGFEEIPGSLFEIFPNPSDGIFNLKLNIPTFFTLTDLTGKIIQSGKMESGITFLDLSRQSKGVYFMRLTHAGSSQVQKIFLE